jgi:acyl carrier protein
MKDLYAKLATILEVDTVRPEDRLAGFDAWDSLSILSIVAMVGADFGVRMSAVDINQLATAGDLEKAILSRSPRA